MHAVVEKISSVKDHEHVSEKTKANIAKLIETYGNEPELIDSEIAACEKAFTKANTEIQAALDEIKRKAEEQAELERQQQEQQAIAEENARKEEEQRIENVRIENERIENERIEAEKQQKQLEALKNVVFPHQEHVKKHANVLTPELKQRINAFAALHGKFMKSPSETNKKAVMKFSESIVADINHLLQKQKTLSEEQKRREQQRIKGEQLKQEREKAAKAEAERKLKEEQEAKRKEEEEKQAQIDADNKRIADELAAKRDREGEYENEYLKGFLGY